MAAVQNVTEPMPLPARLIESAIALARAELVVVLVHTRELAVRAVTALLATIIAAAFAPTALLLIVLSPFLVELIAIEVLVVGIVLSLGVALAACIVALFSWRSVWRSAQHSVSSKSPDVSLPARQRAGDIPRVPEPSRPAPPVETHQHQATTPVTLAERMI